MNLFLISNEFDISFLCRYLMKTGRKLRLSHRSSLFKENWNKIIYPTKTNLNYFQNEKCSINDNYFTNIPFKQEILTNEEMIIKEKINFSNYTELSSHEINRFNIYECFHGILFYIYFYSKNKFNIEEIEIHFTGAKNIFWENKNKFNIINIFDYENISTEINIESTVDAFFGVTFKRIKIQPISYSIRSGIFSNQVSHLVSFTFEGFDEENQQWDVLDERLNINDLINSGGFSLFYVRTTTKCYSSFKLKQIGQGSNNTWGFSLSAFDIHGIIYYKNESLFDNDDLSNVDYNELDPCIDISDYII